MTKYEEVAARFAARQKAAEMERINKENAYVSKKYVNKKTIQHVVNALEISEEDAIRWIGEMSVARYRKTLKLAATEEDVSTEGALVEARARGLRKDEVVAERVAMVNQCYLQQGKKLITYDEYELFTTVVALHDSLKNYSEKSSLSEYVF